MTIEPLARRGRSARLLAAAALAAVAVLLPGCGEEEVPRGTTKKAVTFEDVPEGVRKAASKAIPGIPFKEAWENLEPGGKLHSYEIRGKNPADGKTREVRVSPSGEILEME